MEKLVYEEVIEKLKKLIKLYELSTKLDYDKIKKLEDENKKLKDELNLNANIFI